MRSEYLALVPALLFTSSAAYSDDIFVDVNNSACSDSLGAPFCSIEAAIEYATIDGDTILVHPGNYAESIDFLGRDIVLKSINGPTGTVISGTAAPAVLIGPVGRIEGFTITSGTMPAGAGMEVFGNGTVVRNNIFEHMSGLGSHFGVAIGGNSASPVIDSNIFRFGTCTLGSERGIVEFVNFSRPLIINNVFHDNACAAIDLLLPEGSRPVVAHNTLVRNRTAIRMGGNSSAERPLFRNNILMNNDVGLEVSSIRFISPVWESNLAYGNRVDFEGIDDPTGMAGNISVDPQHVAAASADFRLMLTSPAIDAGIHMDDVLTDFLGVGRAIDANNDGKSNPDLGALEFSPPQAAAGDDMVALPRQHVTLDGTLSFDADGNIASFYWEQTDGAPVDMTAPDTPMPTLEAPESPGLLSFELTVTDDLGATNRDAVSVRVNAGPIADAGQDFVANAGVTATLDGSRSNDSDGTITMYQWQQAGGPSINLLEPDSETSEFTVPDISGLATFNLTIWDNDGAMSNDSVNVQINEAPVAMAGQDVIINAGASDELDGGNSADSDGSIVAFSWTQIAGTPVVMLGADSMRVRIIAPDEQETLEFALIVTDEHGAQGMDTVSVFVVKPASGDTGGNSSGGGSVNGTLLVMLLLFWGRVTRQTTRTVQSRKFSYCSGISSFASLSSAMTACKSSRFLPVTRTFSP